MACGLKGGPDTINAAQPEFQGSGRNLFYPALCFVLSIMLMELTFKYFVSKLNGANISAGRFNGNDSKLSIVIGHHLKKKVALPKLKDGFWVYQAEPSPTAVWHLVKQMVKVDLSRIVNSFQLICISTTWLHSLNHTVILRARFFFVCLFF